MADKRKTEILERLEKLFLRDLGITEEHRANDEYWSTPIYANPTYSYIDENTKSMISPTSISNELVTEIKNLLQRDTFCIQFTFRGMQLIDYRELTSLP